MSRNDTLIGDSDLDHSFVDVYLTRHSVFRTGGCIFSGVFCGLLPAIRDKQDRLACVFVRTVSLANSVGPAKDGK